MKTLAAYTIAMVTAHAELLEHAMVELPALQRGAADAVVAGLEHGAVRHNPTDEQYSSMLKCEQHV